MAKSSQKRKASDPLDECEPDTKRKRSSKAVPSNPETPISPKTKSGQKRKVSESSNEGESAGPVAKKTRSSRSPSLPYRSSASAEGSSGSRMSSSRKSSSQNSGPGRESRSLKADTNMPKKRPPSSGSVRPLPGAQAPRKAPAGQKSMKIPFTGGKSLSLLKSKYYVDNHIEYGNILHELAKAKPTDDEYDQLDFRHDPEGEEVFVEELNNDLKSSIERLQYCQGDILNSTHFKHKPEVKKKAAAAAAYCLLEAQGKWAILLSSWLRNDVDGGADDSDGDEDDKDDGQDDEEEEGENDSEEDHRGNVKKLHINRLGGKTPAKGKSPVKRKESDKEKYAHLKEGEEEDEPDNENRSNPKRPKWSSKSVEGRKRQYRPQKCVRIVGGKPHFFTRDPNCHLCKHGYTKKGQRDNHCNKEHDDVDPNAEKKERKAGIFEYTCPSPKCKNFKNKAGHGFQKAKHYDNHRVKHHAGRGPMSAERRKQIEDEQNNLRKKKRTNAATKAAELEDDDVGAADADDVEEEAAPAVQHPQNDIDDEEEEEEEVISEAE